jgi:hypothetical protein
MKNNYITIISDFDQVTIDNYSYQNGNLYKLKLEENTNQKRHKLATSMLTMSIFSLKV